MVAWLGALAAGGAVASAAALAPAPGAGQHLAGTVPDPAIAVVIIGAVSTAVPAGSISPPA
jgi:hypothetical protein